MPTRSICISPRTPTQPTPASSLTQAAFKSSKPLLTLISAFFLTVGASSSSQAVTIATLDFGVNPDVASSSERIESGFDFVNNDDTPEDDSGSNHGTAIVQGLLADAPNSRIEPLKVTGPGAGWDLTRGDAALNFILQRDDIKVIDFPSLQPVSIGRLRSAVNQGKVVVIDAGNGAQSAPSNQARSVAQLNGGGIVVGAVDGNNQIHPISNRAGDLADSYIVAPAGNANTSIQSTTFSRNKVSAAAARIYEAAPHLTPQQVAEILFNTAVDLGSAGIDSTYGNGLLDVERALSPQGLTSVGGDDGSTASSGGGSGGAGLGALVVAGALGYALTRRSDTLKKTLVLDQYERAYQINLIDRAPKLGHAGTPALLGFSPNRVNRDQAPLAVVNHVQAGTQQMLSISGEDQTRLPGRILNLDEDAGHKGKLLWHSMQGDGREQVFALNQAIPHYFGATTQTNRLRTKNNPFATPYFGFAEHGASMKLGNQTHTQQGKWLSQFGFSSADDQGRHGAQSNAILFGGVLEKERSAFGLQIGYTIENGALFGSANNGPLGVAGAETLSLTLSGQHQLNPRLTLLGTYSHGHTSVNAAKGSLLQQFTSLSSRSAAVGLLAESVLTQDDQLSFIVSQPLSITRGAVDVHTPVQLDADRNVLFEDETVNLGFENAPETRYELVYNRALANGLEWQSRLLYRDGSYVSDAAVFGLSTMISYGF